MVPCRGSHIDMKSVHAIARVVAALLAIGLASLAGLSMAMAEPRVALIIGNADYGSDMGRLANPVNDAALMQKSLTQAGFEVIAVTDADQKEMKRAISDFGKRLTAAGADVTALFYYSGHGLQVSGENYLIPVKAHIAAEADVDLEAVSADTILKQMQFADSRVNIIILDACRNNPLPRGFRSAQAGLARIEAPRGSFVAYSTAPGDVARDGTGKNSPYTAALAQAIIQPGITIEEAFRDVRGNVLSETGNAQTPWESSSLTAPFYFTPAKSTSTEGNAPAPVPSAETVQDPREIEVTFWNSVKDSKDPADFTAYLEQYPQGNFARLAQNRLVMLTGNAPPPAAETPAASPESEESTTAESTSEVATAPADVPTDAEAAGKMCRDEQTDAAHRLAACQNALQKNGLDDAARADLSNEIGRAYYGLQKYPEAQAAYRQAMELDPKEPVYPANLGLALSDARDFQTAIDAYTQAIALSPKDIWLYYNRGFAYLYSNDAEKAGADLDAALALEENFDLLSGRGFIALAEGDDQKAVEFTARAIQQDGNVYNLQSIAVLYLAERDKEASAMTDRLIKADQGYGYGQIWKAMLLARQGKSGAARTLLTKTLEAHGNDWPGMLMRWMLGKIDAETLLLKAHEGTKQDVQNQLCEANFYLGERAFAKGEKVEAAAYFAAALDTKIYHYIEYFAAEAYQRRLQAAN